MNKKLAGCILTDLNNRVLLIHRNTARLKQWELPGGKVEAGETEAQTASRETLEELGVEVDCLQKVGQAEFYDNNVHWHYSWFKAKITTGTPAIREPHTFDDIDYFDLADANLKNVVLSPNVIAIVSALKNKQLQL
jgi:8-oxo-dGTP diphosphatase